jgi:hypothetical protein
MDPLAANAAAKLQTASTFIRAVPAGSCRQVSSSLCPHKNGSADGRRECSKVDRPCQIKI